MAEGRSVSKKGVRGCPCKASAYQQVKSLSQDSDNDWFKISHAKCTNEEGLEFDVVLKIFDLDKNATETLDDIQKEVAVMRKCSHDNIVRLYACFVEGEDLWMVLDYMNRGSCRDQLRLKYTEGFPEDIVNCVLAQTLRAIEYLHGQDMIHRDIKADNLLIDSSYRVKVTDFWISSVGNEGAGKKKAMTFIGTPCWMAPEVIEQESGYDCKADIWSFGITLLELAKGKAPFEGQKPLKVLKSILRANPPTLEGSFSSELKNVVEACLQKDPTSRPEAVELREVSIFKNAQLPRTCELIELGAIMAAEQTAKTPRLSLETEEWTFDDWSGLDTMTEFELNRSVEELVESSQSDSMTIEQMSANEIPVLDNILIGDVLADEKPQMNGISDETVSLHPDSMLNCVIEDHAATLTDAEVNMNQSTVGSSSNETDLNGFPELDTSVGKNPLSDDSLQTLDLELAHSPVNARRSPKPSPRPSPKLGAKSPKTKNRWGQGQGQRRSVSFADMPELDINVETLELTRQASSPSLRDGDAQRQAGDGATRSAEKLESSSDTLLSDSSAGADLSNFVITEDSPSKPDAAGSSEAASSPPGKTTGTPPQGAGGGSQGKADDVWSELEKMLNEPTSPRQEGAVDSGRRGSLSIQKDKSPDQTPGRTESCPQNGPVQAPGNPGIAPYPVKPSPQLTSQGKNGLSVNVKVPPMSEERHSNSPANRPSTGERSNSVKDLHSSYTSPKTRASLDVPSSRHSIDMDAASAFTKFGDFQRPLPNGDGAANGAGLGLELKKNGTDGNKHNKKFVITDLEAGAKTGKEGAGERPSSSPPRSPLRQIAATIPENGLITKTPNEKPMSATKAVEEAATGATGPTSAESSGSEMETPAARPRPSSSLLSQGDEANLKQALTSSHFSSSANSLSSVSSNGSKHPDAGARPPKFVIKDAPDSLEAKAIAADAETLKAATANGDPAHKGGEQSKSASLDTSKHGLQPSEKCASTNKPRTPDSDDSSGGDLETMDSDQLRVLVRQLQSKVKKLQEENRTLVSEKRELEKRGSQHSPVSRASSSPHDS